MSGQLLLTLALAPFAFLGARELRKASRTGVIDDGGDWDFHIDHDRPAFFIHYLLMIAPIFAFITSLFLTVVKMAS
jgi:hypothetical protein